MNSSSQTITPPDAAAALGEDIAARRHLLWLSGVRGAREAVWTMLQESLTRALILRISPRQTGDLLPQVLSGLGLSFDADAVVRARRELALRLTAAAQQQREIVVIVDPAHQLDDDDDVGLLLHFFPPGPTTIVFGGQGDPRTWRPYGAARERALESAAHYVLAPPLAAVRARSAAASDVRSPIAAPPDPSVLDADAPPGRGDRLPSGTSTPEAPIPEDGEAGPPAAANAAPQQPDIAPIIVDGRPDYVRQSRQRQEIERQLHRWRALAVASMLALAAVGAIELFDADASRWLNALRDDAPAPPAASSPAPSAQPGPPQQPAEDPGAGARATDAENAPIPAEQASNEHPAEPPQTPPPVPVGESTHAAADASSGEPTTQADAAPSTSAESLAREAAAAPAAEPGDTHAVTAPAEPTRAKRAPTSETRGQARDADAAEAAEQYGIDVETLADLYADRAEYELEKGRAEEATASIAHGLAIDPDNSRLLGLQVVLRSANSPQAPPFTKPQ